MNDMLNDFYFGKGIENYDELVDALIECSREDICILIKKLPKKEINPANIPQYSSFADGTSNLIQFLRKAGDFGPSFLEVGQHYLEGGHTERAYVKYGENHAKLSNLLGTTVIKKEDRRRVFLNELGRAIEHRTIEEQHECFIKLSGLIPIVQFALQEDIENDKELECLLCKYLAPTTAVRRRHNTWYLIAALRGEEN